MTIAGAKLADEERGRRAVAVVRLVAHVQRLGDDAPQVDGAGLLQRPLQRRVERRIHPLEPLQHVVSVGTVAQHAPQPLVLRGVGHVAKGLVLDDEDGHRRREDARHGPDGVMVVARIELELARCRHLRRLFVGLGPALVDRRAHNRAARRPAHALPLDGWPRVQDHPLAYARDHLARDAHADEARASRADLLQRLGVGLVDINTALRLAQLHVAFHGRTPRHVDSLSPLIFQTVRKILQPDVDSLQLLIK